MPELLTNPTHWRTRAEEARERARQLDDPEAKAVQRKMADKYDRLADCAAEWLNKTEEIPQFLTRPLQHTGQIRAPGAALIAHVTRLFVRTGGGNFGEPVEQLGIVALALDQTGQ